MRAAPLEILWTLIVLPGMVRSLQNVVWSRQVEEANVPYRGSTERVQRAAWIHAHSTKLVNWGLLVCEAILFAVGVFAMLSLPPPDRPGGPAVVAFQALFVAFGVVLSLVSDYSYRVSKQLERELSPVGPLNN